MHQRQKFGKNPPMDTGDIAEIVSDVRRIDARTEGRTRVLNIAFGAYDGAQGPHLPELTPLFFCSRIEWSGYLHSTLFLNSDPVLHCILCLIIDSTYYT